MCWCVPNIKAGPEEELGGGGAPFNSEMKRISLHVDHEFLQGMSAVHVPRTHILTLQCCWQVNVINLTLDIITFTKPRAQHVECVTVIIS